jgi:choline dehydrogenase-like flavoprotein
MGIGHGHDAREGRRIEEMARGRESHDVVIVGAGSAGCVLAARLSEDPSRSVLLLEAGRDFPGGADGLPAELRKEEVAFPSPAYSWSYEGRVVGAPDRSVPVFRGRVVGGSGAINGALLQQGLPEDYDAWGSPRWSYEAVRPYLERLVQNDGRRGESSGGVVPVRRLSRETWPASQTAFFRSARRYGFSERDAMDSEASGIGAAARNSHDGVRLSAALTHLEPARSRPNLVIKGGATVRRILLAGDRATGVEFEAGGERFQASAEETILAAGAIGSPHLLMVSGIGPAEVLSRHGIPVVEHLAGVGRNLSDHPVVNVDVAPEVVDEDPRHHVALVYSSGPGEHNDMQVLVGAALVPDAEGRVATRLLVSAMLGSPDSRGEIDLRSADPSIPPRIHFHYLESTRDRQRLRESLRLSATLLTDDAFAEIGITRVRPSDKQLASDAQLDAFVRENVFTVFHGCGTCKMGPAADHHTVVDDRCYVHGLQRLRVADLSIAPQVPRAATNATALMIGERVAEL